MMIDQRGRFGTGEDPTDIPGDPKLENLMMTEEEERDFETFALASPNVSKRKSSWRASQENTKLYSRAQVHHQDDSFTSQARPVVSQALDRDQVQGQAQPLLEQAQSSFISGPACESGAVSSTVASRSRLATSSFGTLWRSRLSMEKRISPLIWIMKPL